MPLASASELHSVVLMSGEPDKPARSKPRSSKSVIVGVTLIALAAGGGATWFFAQRSAGAQSTVRGGPSAAPKYLVHLEGFTVNLADPEETHFLRVTLDLGLDQLPQAVEREKPANSLPIPRIRDTILSVLTLCKANELLTPEGKSRLKKDLLEALKRDVPDVPVREVYFTEFLVQR